MAKILFTAKNMAGLLHPLLEMARRLQVDGHDVAFMGAAPATPMITAHGFRMVPLTEDRAALARMRAAEDEPWLRRLRHGWRERRQLDQLNEIREAVEREQPDLLIHDVEMHATIMATAKLDIPAIVTTPWCSVFRDSSVAPMHTTTDPSQDQLGLQGRRDWLKLIARRIWTQDIKRRLNPAGRLERLTTPYPYHIIDRRVLSRLARVHRFGLRKNTTQLNWLRPHMYRHLPVVSTVLEEFDLPQRTPAHFRYVGPMVHIEPAQASISETDRDTVDQALRMADDPDRRLVYFSVGTRSGETLAIASKVIDAYRNATDAVVLLSIGRKHEIDELDTDLPAHVFVVNFSPQFDVLAAADLAIIHGGIGTINQCIFQKVPMLVHRYGDVDQPGCALRVEHHGLGRRLDLLAASADEIRDAGDSVRNDPTISANLDRFADHSQRYRDDKVIEGLANDVIAGRWQL